MAAPINNMMSVSLYDGNTQRINTQNIINNQNQNQDNIDNSINNLLSAKEKYYTNRCGGFNEPDINNVISDNQVRTDIQNAIINITSTFDNQNIIIDREKKYEYR